jgi:hypothetical protein
MVATGKLKFTTTTTTTTTTNADEGSMRDEGLRQREGRKGTPDHNSQELRLN